MVQWHRDEVGDEVGFSSFVFWFFVGEMLLVTV